MKNEKTADATEQQSAQWWQRQGQAMWDARSRVGEFLGEEVFVIRFERNGEQCMPMVIVQEEERGIALTIGGLIGSTFKGYDDRTGKHLSTYSSGVVCAKTIEEALYKATH